MKPAIEVAKKVYSTWVTYGEGAPDAKAASVIEADRAEHVREIRKEIAKWAVRGGYAKTNSWGQCAEVIIGLSCLQLPDPEPSKEALAVVAEYCACDPLEVVRNDGGVVAETRMRLARIIDKHMRSHGT
jgi:hypothetical protein